MTADPEPDIEAIAFEGVSIDFQFESNNPTFGELFLIVGSENPNFPPQNRGFENLSQLDFEQVDDYFGIRNNTEKGDDIKIWLMPIVNGQEVHHHEGPFDAVRITYVVVRNTVDTKDLFEKIFQEFQSNLDAKPFFNGKEVTDFSDIEKVISIAVEYCRNDLKVKPGSEEAMMLDW